MAGSSFRITYLSSDSAGVYAATNIPGIYQ